MSWNQDNNKGPWGQNSGGNRGGSGPSGPNDFEDFIRKAQAEFKNKMPGGFQNFAGIGILALIAFAIWISSGIYIPREGEKAVVLRFGEYVRTTGPGLNWHVPYPIEEVLIRNVSEVQQFNSENSGNTIQVAVGGLRESGDQPLVLTGDENIAEVVFTVQWFISDLSKYLFKTREPNVTIEIAAESVIREIIGQTPIADVLTTGRGAINQRAQEKLQELADEYELGIQVKEISLQRVDPPASVIESYRNVQRAKAQKERKINQAESVRNSIIPVAEGEAIKIIQNAEAYKDAKVSEAKGDAARFLSVLEEYKKAPEITKKRLKIETSQRILASAPQKLYFDNGTEGAAKVLPHMALPAVRTPAPQPKGADE